MKNKVLILGINGFTGKHFANYVLKNSLTNDFLFKGYDINKNENVPFETEIIDLSIKENIEKIITNEYPDFIINLICSARINDFESLIKLNVILPKNIIEVVISKNIRLKKLLLIGSAAEYGKNNKLPLTEESALYPVNLYGLSKVYQSKLVEYYFNNFSLNINIARTFNIFSNDLPSSLSIGSFIKQINDIKDEGIISVGNLGTKRDFLHIENIIDAYWKILLDGKKGQIYNVCSGKSILVKEILDWLILKSGKKIIVHSESARFKKFDIDDSYGDNKKIINDTSWEPIFIKS